MTGSKNILLIDSNEAAAKYVRDMLQYYGYTVRLARDWDAGQRALREHGLDLIIFDECHVHRGLGTPLNALREEGYDQPVLIMSDIALKEMWAGCMELGHVDLINKPVSPSTLKIMVEAALKRARPARVIPVIRLGGLPPDALTAS